MRRAEDLGLDLPPFRRRTCVARGRPAACRDDMLDAEAMDITAVPTFFINGRRHVGPYDAQSLIRALEAPVS